VSKDYDDATAEMAELHAWFENYLREQKQATGIASLQYWGNGKDRYQMEAPMDRCSKVPANWESKSQKKTHRRYWTPKLQAKLGELIEAEGKMDAAQKDTLRAIFAKFDESHAVWSVGVACMALLDALLSLASISALPNYCWPDICHAQPGDGVSAASSAELCIVNGRHPMLEFTLSTHSSDAEYIANSLHLGGSSSDQQGAPLNPRLMLLSGPNMGGKSTLLRQTCLIAIMAQMGCKVPADSVRMTPVDRIFTRVGASDRILAGQSTFFVELAETATILKLATKVRY
jgi:DNA mismatch repair protein MSH6